MQYFQKLLLYAAALVCASFPLLGAPVTCPLTNDFATPAGDFGSCWFLSGDVVAGAAGVGPTLTAIAGGGGVLIASTPSSMSDLQSFIGNGDPFLFSNFTSEIIGSGSAIQNSLTLTAPATFHVNYTNANPAGSIGFVVIENLANTTFSFFTLFDNPNGAIVLFTAGPDLSLETGSYTISVGIAGASTSTVLVPASIGIAAGAPQSTGITIQGPSSVPEPNALGLMAGGLLGLAFVRRRIVRRG